MRLLLDTHIFIWWDSSPEQLLASTRKLLENQANTLVLSVASVWEMQIKHQLGKVSLNKPLADLVQGQQAANSLEVLPVQLAHVLALDSLPYHHKDPFDRLLIAQSLAENLVLVTVDPAIRQYGVNVLS